MMFVRTSSSTIPFRLKHGKTLMGSFHGQGSCFNPDAFSMSLAVHHTASYAAACSLLMCLVVIHHHALKQRKGGLGY